MSKIIDFVKGFFIGIAVVIPGLSGSIFAVVVGLYDKILYSINNFRKNPIKSILFLIPIILGCILGVFASAKLILWVCETYTQQSYFFFIGLVIGSIPITVRKLSKIPFKPKYLLLTIISFVCIAFFSYLSAGNTNSTTEIKNYVAIDKISNIYEMLIVFGSGLFSCAMMAIPGVSGSIMLMIINQYGTVYNSVAKLSDIGRYLLQGNLQAATEASSSIFVVITFALGSICGFIIIAKFIGFILKKYEALTYYAVTGLVVGSIFALFKNGVLTDPTFISSLFSTHFIIVVLFDVMLIFLGVICTRFMDTHE